MSKYDWSKFIKYDWNKFTKRVSINTSENKIYTAWSTQNGLESWFLSKAEFTEPDEKSRDRNSHIQKDDSYLWNWHGYADYVGTGKILQTNEKDFLEFTFTGGCIVNVTIKQEAAETVCELVQMMPHEKEEDRQHYYIECGKGWTFYLANLKSVLEGGLDLRNKNNHLTNVVNA